MVMVRLTELVLDNNHSISAQVPREKVNREGAYAGFDLLKLKI